MEGRATGAGHPVISISALWWRRPMRWIGGEYSAPRWHRVEAPGMTVCGRPVAGGETRAHRPERAICHNCEPGA